MKQPYPLTHLKPEHRPFVRTILEAPDDDLPRLVYADFLDEQGDILGEFIRIQLELETFPVKFPLGPEEDKFKILWKREQEILTPERVWEWCRGGVDALGGPGSPDATMIEDGGGRGCRYRIGPRNIVTFRRGFPDRITCTFDEWFDDNVGPRIVRTSPVTRIVVPHFTLVAEQVGEVIDELINPKETVRFPVYRYSAWVTGGRSVWLPPNLGIGLLNEVLVPRKEGSESPEAISPHLIAWAKSVDPDDPRRTSSPTILPN